MTTNSSHGTSELSVRYAIVAAAVPLALVVLVGGATWFRLRAETERVAETEALVARTWIGDAAAAGDSAGLSGRVEPARPRLEGGGLMSRLLWRLVLAATGIVLAAALFGAVFGRDLAARLESLQRRFELLLEREGRSSRVDLDEALDGGDPLVNAALGLEERLSGELAMFRDAAEEVETVDARRTRFLTNVAGELNGPLEKIVDQAKRLVDGEAGPFEPGQAEDLRIVRQAGERLQDIASDILDFSSLITKEIDFDDQLLDLGEVAREVIETARGQLAGKSIEVACSVEEPSPPMVRGSRRRMWQVLTNLVSNGIKFTESGEVRISLEGTAGGEARIRVSDTGVGIAEEDQEAVFDPFRQRGEPSKRLRGTGLGLAIAKRLVELHGGQISLSSREGEGSVFTVILPGKS